jgi:hypothetical protein
VSSLEFWTYWSNAILLSLGFLLFVFWFILISFDPIGELGGVKVEPSIQRAYNTDLGLLYFPLLVLSLPSISFAVQLLFSSREIFVSLKYFATVSPMAGVTNLYANFLAENFNYVVILGVSAFHIFRQLRSG